jgi:hypothetical protein
MRKGMLAIKAQLRELVDSECMSYSVWTGKTADVHTHIGLPAVQLEMEYEVRGWDTPRDLVIERFKEELNV